MNAVSLDPPISPVRVEEIIGGRCGSGRVVFTNPEFSSSYRQPLFRDVTSQHRLCASLDMPNLFSLISGCQSKPLIESFKNTTAKVRNMLYRPLLFLIISYALCGAAHAQDPFDPNGRERVSAIELEMRARRDIKAAEKEHQANLERAVEAAKLGIELRDTYAQTKSFVRTDVKKLERLDKLTRKIRSEAGGSDDRDSTLEKVPAQLEAAISRLAEVSEEMRKGVEKTPRQVISASVIEHANELLDIITYIRQQTR